MEAEAEKAEDDKQEEEAEANSQLTPQKRKPLGERKPIIGDPLAHCLILRHLPAVPVCMPAQLMAVLLPVYLAEMKARRVVSLNSLMVTAGPV